MDIHFFAALITIATGLIAMFDWFRKERKRLVRRRGKQGGAEIALRSLT